MRWLVLAAFVLVTPAGGVRATQVISAEEIAAAGITRLSEILTLADGWTGITTDGYTWRASPEGLAPFEHQRWVVMVDHQVFDVVAFDAVNLNLLPISIDQVHRVTVESAPGVVAGEYAGHGLITFHTRPPHPRDGLRFDAYVQGGNETGDPGPYRYTDRGGRNVDATGPDLALTIGGARGQWRASLNTSVLVHYFTDPAMRRRTTGILGLNDPRGSGPGDLFLDESSASMRQASISMRVGRTGSRTANNLFLAASSAQRYLHYSPVFGRETPADQRLLHAGVHGSIAQRERFLIYDSQVSVKRLSRPSGAHFDYDWKTTRSRTRVLAAIPEPVSVTVGAGLDHVWAQAATPLEDNTVLVVPVYGELGWRNGPVHHTVGGMLSFTDEDKADRIYLGGVWPLDGSSLSWDVSLAEQLVAENRDLWLWTERGYALLDSNDVDYTIDGVIGTRRMATADVRWKWKRWWHTHGEAAAIYRGFDDLDFQRHHYAFDEEACAFTGPVEVVTGQGGHVAGGRVRVTAPAGPWAQATLRYRYQRAFNGDTAFDDAWQPVPDHLASLRITARPRPDLTAQLSLAWRSATQWPDYVGVDGATCTVGGETVTYRSRLDDVFSMDAAVGKRLWGGRASIDLAGRNLLNGRVQYHPAGATFDLSFFAQLRVILR